ncbi:MAG: geranylgeranylglycerol-phosphate geranylgeranyltransferase [Flavobacteriaceae bacterium]|nr:geranylgeranylglycerol-phosphate geranylgeranyltransferase [Flavobacteriaceae bacterium]
MISFLKLIRYKNLLLVFLTLALTKYALIAPKLQTQFSTIDFLLLSFGILAITAGGYIINDIYDINTDVINKPQKQYIGVTFSKQKGLIYYFVLTIVGLVAGTYISFTSNFLFGTLIFIGCASTLYLYAAYFKRRAFIGNLLVSFCVAFTIIIVYAFESAQENVYHNFFEAITHIFSSVSLSLKIITYSIFAFFMTLLRELIKDIEDIKGDYAANMKTLPILIGIQRTKRAIFIISCAVLLFMILILKEIADNFILIGYCSLFIFIPFLFFIRNLWTANTNKHYQKLSKWLKIIMLFGILSMLLFKFQ